LATPGDYTSVLVQAGVGRGFSPGDFMTPDLKMG
jgi:hypothetical protein